MSARRLGRRLAGLGFVLAAVFGGVGAASHAVHGGGECSTAQTSAVAMHYLEGVWN